MPDIQSSFIPKQVLTPDLRARKQPVGLFLLLSVVVLIISVLFLGGVYAYKFKINDDINGACPTDDPNDTNGCGLIASIAKVREGIDQNLIKEIETLDKLLRRSTAVLENHKTYLPVFQLIEDQTLQTIRYSSFNQVGTAVTLRGTARNYEGIALQSDIFSKDERIADFVFSDLNADTLGRVSFGLKIDLDPSVLSYYSHLTAATDVPPPLVP